MGSRLSPVDPGLTGSALVLKLWLRQDVSPLHLHPQPSASHLERERKMGLRAITLCYFLFRRTIIQAHAIPCNAMTWNGKGPVDVQRYIRPIRRCIPTGYWKTPKCRCRFGRHACPGRFLAIQELKMIGVLMVFRVLSSHQVEFEVCFQMKGVVSSTYRGIPVFEP